VEIVVNASSVKKGKAKGTLGQVGVQGGLLLTRPSTSLSLTRGCFCSATGGRCGCSWQGPWI